MPDRPRAAAVLLFLAMLSLPSLVRAQLPQPRLQSLSRLGVRAGETADVTLARDRPRRRQHALVRPPGLARVPPQGDDLPGGLRDRHAGRPPRPPRGREPAA